MLGTGVLACELAGLAWLTIYLAKLKIDATIKSNAKKSEIQAAAKECWDLDLQEDGVGRRLCA